MTTRSRTLFSLGLTMLLTTSGCATLQFPWDDKTPEASKKNPVVQVTCLWEPSEGRGPDGAPCRGFAGQILFLGNKAGMPVKIDGSVMVYLFDDQGTPEEQAAPIHQYSFDTVAWSQHLRVGSMGPTYHVFIPYTRKGVYQANCSLRLKLTPETGSVIYSDSAAIPLRGRKRPTTPAAETISHYGQRPEGESRDGPRTTTIPLDGRELEPNSTEFDQERADRLLQQFLKEQADKDLNRAQQSSSINRGTASERIRWTGESVERITPAPQQSLAKLLPEPQEEIARRDHPLSTHPFADHSEPAPRRIKGMPQRHPLDDEAAYPRDRRSVTAVESEAGDWSNADGADALDGQTSQYNGRP